jgi:hypothetical protein
MRKILSAGLILFASALAHASSSMPAQSVSVQNWKASANDPIACRLTDGSSWYTASGGGSGGSNAAASNTGSAVPAAASYTGYNSGGNLVGVSTANALPVAQQGSVAVTGTFWPPTQPVSGTFWQSTQPVSIASMPSTPVTGTFWQSTQPVSGPLTDTQLRAVAVPVSGTFWQSTQPVSGTFWQTTQPVSGPLTDTQLRATPVPVSGTVAATQSGTFTVQPGNTANTTAWKVDGSAVTQPISHANLDVALSTRLKPADTLAAVTTVSTVSAVTSITNALPAGTNRLGSTRPVDSADADLTAAKGSQTSRALGTQDLKDAGRTQLRFYFNAVAAGATGTETAITMTKSAGTGATSSAASFVITSGKTMRLTSVTFGSRGNATATAQVTNCRIRVNTAGAVVTTSTPVIYDLATATPATASAWDRVQIQGIEGDEIAGNGTIQFGVTCAATYTTNAPTWFGMITGYEY